MLAAFWFLYFTGLGIFYPFYSLYLHDDAGLDGGQVGIVLAVMPLVGMIAQPLWGQIADRSGRRVAVLVAVTIGAAVGYAALWGVSGFWGFMAGTAALALFAWAVVPIAFSVTFAALRGAGPHAFGLVRVWGTIGYLIAVAAFPSLVAWMKTAVGGEEVHGLQLMFPATAACVLAAAVVALWLPRGGVVAVRARRGEWRGLLQQRAVVRLLVFTFVGYLFLQGPMGMFPIFVRAHGGTVETVGRMWVVMLLLEIPLVALSGAGLRRLGGRGLLAVGVLAGGLRWTACAFVDDVAILYAVQLLHGIVVVGLLLGGPMYLDLVVPEALRSTAQALVAMAGAGLGSIISNTGAGWLVEHHGANAPFLIGGVGALLLGASATWILPRPEGDPGTAGGSPAVPDV